MSEPSYTYIRVSKTDALESSAQQYRHLRLQGLEASPESFSSTYETEAAFSNDDWIQRLSAPDRETFICVANAAGGQDAPGIGDWVGQVTLRGPIMKSDGSCSGSFFSRRIEAAAAAADFAERRSATFNGASLIHAQSMYDSW
ncbi:hypothetical protein NHJ13734_006571 [Beauveria thailandica]